MRKLHLLSLLTALLATTGANVIPTQDREVKIDDQFKFIYHSERVIPTS